MRLGICPNAYYNYRKHRKADDYAQKEAAKALIREIYHMHNGVAGYRTMTVYLARMGCHYSAVTIHKYMNTEMRLHSLVRPKKPGYVTGAENRIKFLKTSCNGSFKHSGRTTSGVRISHICF